VSDLMADKCCSKTPDLRICALKQRRTRCAVATPLPVPPPARGEGTVWRAPSQLTQRACGGLPKMCACPSPPAGAPAPQQWSSADGFHNPRELRYRRGRTSPEGFYFDSYDYAALRRYLLDPLGPGGSGVYRSAVFDHVTDSPVPVQTRVAPPGAALILDGLFLHREELRGMWDFSIFLDAPFEITIPRGAARGPGWGGSPDPTAPSNRRYIEGQQIYLRQDQPQARANVVIDYSDLTAPVVTAWR